MFWHEFKNTFKLLSREKSILFRSLIFPLILGVFFKLALGNIDEGFKFKKIPVGVSEEVLEDENFSKFMTYMEDEDYISVKKSKDEKILEEDEDLKVFIKDKDKIIAKSSGLEASFVEVMVDTYLQKESQVKNILALDPQADLEELFKEEDRVKDKTQGEMKFSNTYFYTLVGMQLLYGLSFGLFVSYLYEGNLSTEAKRKLMAPAKKSVSLSASYLVARIFNLVISLFSCRVLSKFMGVSFGKRPGAFFLVILLGSLTGVLFGGLIGVSNKKTKEFKIGLGISLTMFMSFLSGMMVSDMKPLIQLKAPLVNKLNPVALITDSFYSLYYYDSLTRFYGNLARLLGETLVIFALVLFLTRRRDYDSL